MLLCVGRVNQGRTCCSWRESPCNTRPAPAAQPEQVGELGDPRPHLHVFWGGRSWGKSCFPTARVLFLGSVVKGKGRPVTLRDISHVPSGLKTSRAPFCRKPLQRDPLLAPKAAFIPRPFAQLPFAFAARASSALALQPRGRAGRSAWRPFPCLPHRGKASREVRARSASREIVILGLEAKASQQSRPGSSCSPLAARPAPLPGSAAAGAELGPGPGWGRGWGRSRGRGRGWLQPCPAGRRASGGRRWPVRHGEDVNFSTSRCLM